jgi:hypothetical protein
VCTLVSSTTLLYLLLVDLCKVQRVRNVGEQWFGLALARTLDLVLGHHFGDILDGRWPVETRHILNGPILRILPLHSSVIDVQHCVVTWLKTLLQTTPASLVHLALWIWGRQTRWREARLRCSRLNIVGALSPTGLVRVGMRIQVSILLLLWLYRVPVHLLGAHHQDHRRHWVVFLFTLGHTS